jgi:DNA polymerase-3 subunit chi
MTPSTKPEIIFYVLKTLSQQKREIFACKLIEKIYRNAQTCYVLIDSAEQAHSLDQQLWTFRAGSFIPHQIYKEVLPELAQTILIGASHIPESYQNLILNLSSTLPTLGPNTERIMEILDNSEESKQAGRHRYRAYQELGLAITTHKL